MTGIAALAVSLLSVSAQDSTAPAPAAQSNLSFGVSDVLKLSQAKVGDDTIVNYIQNSGRAYSGLDANEIVYLHQQGVSDRVVTAMINQRGQSAPAPQPVAQDSSAQYSQPAQQPNATVAVAPTVTYVQPASTVYYLQDSSPRLVDYGYYPYYPYPYYGYYGWGGPSVSLGFNFGGGFHGGGFRGGFHDGGGFHGGGGGGWHGGGHH